MDTLRFETPLYTVTDAARIVDVPASTLAAWARGYTQTRSRRKPAITFVGLAEALVLSAVRRTRVSMLRVHPAIAQLEQEIGVAHALASQKLYTDGPELMFDYAEQHRGSAEGDSAMELVIVRNGHRVFADVITDYLQRIQYGDDGYPTLIRVPAYASADVVVDPRRGFGSPIFQWGGARVADVLERFCAGDSIAELTDEFGVPADQLEDVLRVASRRAA